LALPETREVDEDPYHRGLYVTLSVDKYFQVAKLLLRLQDLGAKYADTFWVEE